jgi:Protein of unknown function (DUF1588)/Protein of unknown function (DUF1592)/Protein of unknown function (DUF1585)
MTEIKRRFRVIAAIIATGLIAMLIESLPIRAQIPAATVDQQYQESDPALYATARRYFPGNTNTVPAKRIFRLTRDQIDTTLASLLPKYVSQSVKSVMPRDALQTNYEYADLLSFNAANIGGFSNWVAEIAARVRENPEGVINCTASGNSIECLTPAARAFVVKAFRGDIGDEKILAFTSFFVAANKNFGLNQAAGDLVEVVLNSPYFLFRKELDVSKSNRLDPAQLLQAVTYTIADSPPEALDLQSQEAGQYLRSGTEAGKTISAIMTTKAAREKIVRFFTAWLEIKAPGEFTISPKVFPDFDPKLEAAFRDETDQFLRTQLYRPSPSLKDITQAKQSMISAALAPIYGTPVPADGRTRLTDLNPAQRLGVFSQPAVLASHSGPTDTRSIKRGVFWVRKVMCMEMEPPPQDLHAKLYDMEGVTERQRIEQSTSGPACAGCHKVINPFAFFQENYDALGRWRNRDHGVPIDSSTLINFLDEEPVKTVGPVEALKLLTSSMAFKQCFVRQLFRFYMGRSEEPADDPLLRRMFFEFAYKDNQDVIKAVQTLTSSDRIVRRQ